MKVKRVKKQNRDLMVSRKYYESLRENVREIVQDAGLRERHFEEIMYLVDRQVGLTPPRQDEEKFLRFSFVVFFTLRIEINKAVARSMAARERARLKAAERAAAQPATPAEGSGVDVSCQQSCTDSRGSGLQRSPQSSCARSSLPYHSISKTQSETVQKHKVKLFKNTK